MIGASAGTFFIYSACQSKICSKVLDIGGDFKSRACRGIFMRYLCFLCPTFLVTIPLKFNFLYSSGDKTPDYLIYRQLNFYALIICKDINDLILVKDVKTIVNYFLDLLLTMNILRKCKQIY